MARCPFGTDCFAEKARDKAGHADVVVTNHALLAIDAISDAAVLPEHELLVVDEAHELVDRVTGVATAELSATVARRRAPPRRAARRPRTGTTPRGRDGDVLVGDPRRRHPGRIDALDDEMTTYLTAVRDAASRVRSAIDTAPSDPKAASARAEAVTALTDISDTATRILASFVPAIPDRTDVVWLDHEDNRGSDRARCCGWRRCRCQGLLRGRLFEQSTAVLTSATLTIGGTFDAMASAWGLAGDGRQVQVARHRRRFAVRAREVGHPLRRRASAAAGARRHRLRRAARRDRSADHRRGRPHARPVLVDARRARPPPR